MRAGELRNFIAIEEPSGTLDSTGQDAGWKTFISVYAKIEQLVGRRADELQANRTLQTPVTVKITTRYFSGVNPNMRISIDGRKMKINAIVDIENKHREMELYCVEVQ